MRLASVAGRWAATHGASDCATAYNGNWRKRSCQAKNQAGRVTAASKVKRPVRREALMICDQASGARIVPQAGGARGWRGGAAIGLLPRPRVSGRREPCRKDPAQGIGKL
jgi:hypothetical protein